MNVGRISERIGEPVVCLRSVSSGEKAPGPRRAEQAAPGDGGGVGRSLAPPRLSAGRSAGLVITTVMCHCLNMALAQSKLTAQGQISVPAEVRRKLGLGPGSVVEWDEDGERVVVRRAGRYTSQEIHHELFDRPPRARTAAELKEGIRRLMRKKHARD